LLVVDASNISIRGLAILGCGQLRNSTTINGPGNETLLFRAALYYLNVKNAKIDDVIVNNSIGMGVAMYDVNGGVSVTNSIFGNNTVPKHELFRHPGGGGFSVEFTYCKPGEAGLPNTSCSSTRVHTNSSIRFYNCTFQRNNASSFINCQWIGNRAQTGSGIDIAAHPFPLGITPVAVVNNCTFTNN